MRLSLTRFSGVAPRYAPHALQEHQAQTASNVRLWKGALEPMPGGLDTAVDLAGVSSGVRKTIYRHGAHWSSWTDDVDVVQSPIAGDTTGRLYYTDSTGAKFTNTLLATSGEPYPFQSYDLGVIAPTSEPLLTPETYTADSDPAEYNLYLTALLEGDVLAFYKDEEETPTEVTVGATVTEAEIVTLLGAVSWVTATADDGFVSIATTATGDTVRMKIVRKRTSVVESYDPDDVTYADLKDNAPDYAPVVITEAEAQAIAVDSYMAVRMDDDAQVVTQVSAGYSTYPPSVTLSAIKDALDRVIPSATLELSDSTLTITPSPETTWLNLRIVVPGTTDSVAETTLTDVKGTTANDLLETRAYVYTFVRNVDGAFDEESAPSGVNSIDVYPGQSVVLTIEQPTTDHTARIYRTATGSQGTNYYYVGSASAAEDGAATTEFTDNIPAEELGEVLPSLTWDMPPSGLQGLVYVGNGILAGFKGKDVYFCDPWHPHAWPAGYSMTVDYDIVGLGTFGQSLLVLTKGTPYVISGTYPDSMSQVKLDIEQACVSKRSIVSFGNGVIYAAPDGLVYVGTDGSQVLSQAYVTHKEWNTILDPSTIHGYEHDRRYYAFHSTGGFIFDPSDQSGALSVHDIVANAAYVDLLADKLYYLPSTDPYSVYALHDGTDKTYTWKSKQFQLPKPINFGVAQIILATNTALTFRLYVDGVLKHTQTVTSSEPFRLPSGYRGRMVEVEFTGTSQVIAAHIAESPVELQEV